MARHYHVGWCPFCNQGWQVVVRDRNTHGLFIRCQECLSEWDSPEAAKGRKLAVFQKHESEGYATREDLLAHSWDQYVENLGDA
jgi:hypothetical protein